MLSLLFGVLSKDRLHAAGRPGAAALLSETVQSQEDIMSELEMKIDMEVEDFTDELSDEALDRAKGAGVGWSAGGCSGCAVCATGAPVLGG